MPVPPPKAKKFPPTKILPSACNAIASTPVRTGIEAGVERAVSVESPDVVARAGAGPAAAEGGGGRQSNLTVRLQRHSLDTPVRTGIEGGVERAISVDSSDEVACGGAGAAAAEGGEKSTD